MKSYTVYDLVMKMNGPIKPAGETNADDKRLENLKELTRVSSMIIDDIADVAAYSARYEHSIQVLSKAAIDHLEGIRDYLNNLLGEETK